MAVEPGIRKLLATAAKETKHTHMEYASAAIRYFAERGLDPVTNHEREGVVIQKRIGEVEQLVVNLGNRLFGWLTQHEKNLNKDLFGFLRNHETVLFDYLQLQERNVHEHLADQEEMFLLPLMRELILTNVEALYGRRLGEQVMLKLMGLNVKEEYPTRHKEFNVRRDGDVNKRVEGFIESLSPTPQPLTSKPQPTPVPQRTKAPTETPPSPAAESPTMTF